MNANGGLDFCVGRTTRVARTTSTGGPRRREFATPFVADPAKRSLVVGTIDFDDDVDAAARRRDAARQRHRRRRALPQARPQPAARRRCSRRSSRTTSSALTACIDYVVEAQAHDRRSSSPRRSAPPASTCCGALRRRPFDTDWARPASSAAIGDYDGILIRSATKLTAELLEHGRRTCKAIGRAGVGVDNVDVPAATKRGIVVANAPQSNVVTAAEHTVALLLALARNIPQAHASLIARPVGALEVRRRRARWTRRSASSASAASASSSPSAPRASACASSPSTRSSAPSATASSASRRPRPPTTSTPQADFITLHLPKTPETEGWLDAEAFAKMQGRRAHPQRRPRPADRRRGPRRPRSTRGKVGGAALDVFRSEPITEHPLFGYAQRRRHAAPRCLDRRGHRPRRLPGRRAGRRRAHRRRASPPPSTSRRSPPRTSRCSGPFVPLCRALGRLAVALAEGQSVDRIEVEYLGRIAERDTRLLAIAVLLGVLAGHTEEERQRGQRAVDRRGARHRGRRDARARQRPRLHRPRARDDRRRRAARERVVGTTLGRRHRPHLLEAWGQRFNLQLDDHLALFRYRDRPGHDRPRRHRASARPA